MVVLHIVICIIPVVIGFNIDTKHAQIFNDSSNNNAESYFGYSVVLQELDYSGIKQYWLVVGAPCQKASEDAMNHPGTVYQCPLSSPGVCTPRTMDLSVFTASTGIYTENKTSAWFGGAIDVQDKGKLSVDCAFRWIARVNTNDSHRNQMNGICYLSKSQKKFTFISPLFNLTQTQTNDGHTNFIHIFGQAGFAAHFVQGNNELLVGAPGVMNWGGTAIKYKLEDGEFIVPRAMEQTSSTSYGYLGYSVGSGKFLNKTITSYVSGAPRVGYTGKVYIFQFPKETNGSIDILQELEGVQMGEYFGTALCVVDFNGDGMDDLLVGAPTHSVDGSRGDEGCVYEYINDDKNNNEKVILTEEKKLCGKTSKARFGFSLAVLGDINKDNFPDIAIGAPYEEAGTVYIYHGTKSGLKQEPSQKISAEMVSPNLRGFGISISRGLDVDNNLYNDFAVGSYTSGHAVLLNTIPIVFLHANLTSNKAGISALTEAFNITACISYKGKDAPQTVGVNVIVYMDGRFKSSENLMYFGNLTLNTKFCKIFPGRFIVSNNLNHLQFRMEYELNESSKMIKYNGKFCKDCTIVNPEKKSSRSLQIPFITDCKNGSNCLIDLKIEAQFKDIKSPFMLGSKEKLKISISVSNTAEPSFQTSLTLELPAQPPLLRLPKNCEDSTHLDKSRIVLMCTFGLLVKNVKRDLTIDLNLRDFFEDPLELKFNMSVKGTGTELNSKDNEYTLQLQTVSYTDVVIEGITTKEQIVYDNNNMEDNVFEHTFKVTNRGPSPSRNIRMEFFIPVGIKSNHQLVKVYKPEEHFYINSQLCKKISGPAFESTKISQGDKTKMSPFIEKSSLDDVQPFTLSNTSTNYEKSLLSTVLPFMDYEEPIVDNRSFRGDEHCPLPWTSCITVECTSIPLRRDESSSVTFHIMTSRSYLVSSFEEHKLVFYITGLAEVIQPLEPMVRNVSVTTVSTTFILNELETILSVGNVIIVGAVLGGLLLFFLIIIPILYKCGFFKRKKPQRQQGKKVPCNSGETS